MKVVKIVCKVEGFEVIFNMTQFICFIKLPDPFFISLCCSDDRKLVTGE